MKNFLLSLFGKTEEQAITRLSWAMVLAGGLLCIYSGWVAVGTRSFPHLCLFLFSALAMILGTEILLVLKEYPGGNR